jgi:hypothetical protein
MTASPIASVRVFETVLPTLSVRVRAIIVLNQSVLGICFGPFIVRQHAPISIHDHVARRSALPRERFSPLALFGHGAMSELSPLSRVERKLDFGTARAAFDPDLTLALAPGQRVVL